MPEIRAVACDHCGYSLQSQWWNAIGKGHISWWYTSNTPPLWWLHGPTGYEWERERRDLSLQFLYHVSETGLWLSKSYNAALRLPPGADTRETWADTSELLPGHALKVMGRERERRVAGGRGKAGCQLAGPLSNLTSSLHLQAGASRPDLPSHRSSSDLEGLWHSPRLRSRRRDRRGTVWWGWGRVGWGRADTESGNCHRNGDETFPSRPLSSAPPLYEVGGLW